MLDLLLLARIIDHRLLLLRLVILFISTIPFRRLNLMLKRWSILRNIARILRLLLLLLSLLRLSHYLVYWFRRDPKLLLFHIIRYCVLRVLLLLWLLKMTLLLLDMRMSLYMILELVLLRLVDRLCLRLVVGWDLLVQMDLLLRL